MNQQVQAFREELRDLYVRALRKDLSLEELTQGVREEAEQKYATEQEKYAEEVAFGMHTCPRRMIEMGPWEREENLDTWQLRGGDRCCSFCGSLHPERFKEIVQEACRNPGGPVKFSRSTKNYKWYVQKPGEGGVKFYTWHIPSEEFAEELNRIIKGETEDVPQ